MVRALHSDPGTRAVARKKMRNLPFEVVGINFDENSAETAERCRSEGITWSSFDAGKLGDTTSDYSRWFKEGIPQFYVIDANGIIRAQFNGDLESINRSLEIALLEMGHEVDLSKPDLSPVR